MSRMVHCIIAARADCRLRVTNWRNREFGNGWKFREEYNYPFIGYSLPGNKDWTSTHVMYRFHIADPICFS